MRARLICLAAVPLLLAACGAGQPGAAAVIDGRTISVAQVDEAAEVICRLSIAQQPGASLPSVEVRGQALAELLLAEVADRVAEAEGITVRTGDVRIFEAQRVELEREFPGLDAETTTDLLETSRRTAAIAEQLGAVETGEEPTATNAAQLRQVGRAELVRLLEASDVELSPRFAASPLAEAARVPAPLSVGASTAPEDTGQDVTLGTRTCA
ncbi:hypothetical protein GCM10009821_16570 [Aeromicrobium halocynthiae]|uniref:DUF541 domain-containing protein n=1 Tax=Aeromicrobium halocynthiae TaxID=560557 RepID=A0ABN2VYI2_9ACTN